MPHVTLQIGPDGPVMEAHLQGHGIQALIGRDVLANCLFVYDRQAGVSSLAF